MGTNTSNDIFDLRIMNNNTLRFLATLQIIKTPGGYSLEKGYGDVRQKRLLFHASSAASQGSLSKSFQFHKALF